MSKFIEITTVNENTVLVNFDKVHDISSANATNSRWVISFGAEDEWCISAEEYARIRAILLGEAIGGLYEEIKPSTLRAILGIDDPLDPANLTMEAVASAGGLKPLVHIRALPSFHTMCGEGLTKYSVWSNEPDVETRATCPECLKLWRSRR